MSYHHIKFERVKWRDAEPRFHEFFCYEHKNISIDIGRSYYSRNGFNFRHIDYIINAYVNQGEKDEVRQTINNFKRLRDAKMYVRCNYDTIVDNLIIKSII